MDELYEINRFLKKSQCYLKKIEWWKYLLYDEFNEYDVKVYEKIDNNEVVRDVKSHLDLKIQDTLNENTIKNIISFFKEQYWIDIVFWNEDIKITLKDWSIKTYRLNEFDSLNVKLLKLELIEKLELF